MQIDVWRHALDLWRAQREGAPGLARRQAARFAELLAYARSASRYYRHHYRDLPADGVALTDLPAVTKQDLMAAFDDWVTAPGVHRADVEAFIADPARIATPFRDRYFVCTSAGTTGHPGIFVSDRGAMNVYRAITAARLLRAWFGAGDWLRLARRGFRWAAVVGTGGHYAGAGWVELERKRSFLYARAFRVFPVQQSLAQLVADLNAFDPGILTGYPSALEILADEQAAGRLRIRPVLLESGGESMAHGAGAHMANAFGCAVRNVYGASECESIALECDHHWLHVNSDWVILEPVDENLRPTPPGQLSHTVLLTNLANRAQPLIRYDLGDSILVRPEPCPCGNPLPAIRVAGRCDDVLHLEAADGRVVKIPPLAIGSVVDEVAGVQRSQLVQTGASTIRVRLVLKPEADGEQVGREVVARLKGYLSDQGLANVELVRASEAPVQRATFGKFRQVLAQPQAAAFTDR